MTEKRARQGSGGTAPDDAELAARLASGDRAAFAMVFARYKSAVFTLAYRLTGDYTEAGDLMQTAFLKLMQAAQSIDPSRSLKGYLLQLTRNASIDYLRRRSRRAATWSQRLGEDAENMVGAATTPSADDLLADEESRSRLEAALAALPTAAREVIVLRSIAQMPFAEVAEILGISVPAAKMRYRRAVDALAEQLQQTTHPTDAPIAGETEP